MRGSADLSQGVPLRALFHNKPKESGRRRQTRPLRPLIAPVGRDQEEKGEFRRRGHKVNLSCGSRTPPKTAPRRPPPLPSAAARRCVPSAAVQAKHGPLSTLARRVITLDWERAERRISLLCYFSRSGLQSRSSRQTSSSLYTVVALQPVYSHTPRGTLTFDL